MAVGLTVSGSSLKACRVRVRGRVQSVGYRRFVLELAQELGLVGYVLNERDDSVTLFAQGGAEPLAKFLESIRVPPRGLVREVAVEEADPVSGLEYFEIRFGSVQEELQEGFGAMESEFSDYRNEFRDYRSEFRDYRQEFRGFATRTDENFRLMSEKYGEISQRLGLLFKAFKAESAETRRMLAEAIESFKRDSAETRERLAEAMGALAEAVRLLRESRAS